MKHKVPIAAALLGVCLVVTAYWLLGNYSPLIRPPPGTETLSMIGYSLNSPTNVTMKLVNTGTAGTTTLIAYDVKAGTGTTYVNSNWGGPTIASGATQVVSVTTDGTVSFQTKMNYTVILTTTKDNNLTFTLFF